MTEHPGKGFESGIPGKPTGILLFEPDLIGFAGHFFGYVSELAKVCQQRGIPLVVISNRNISAELIDYLEKRGAAVEASFGRLKWYGRVLLSGVRFARVALAAVRRHPNSIPITLSGRLPLLIGAAVCAKASAGLSVFQFMNWQNRMQSPAPVFASWLIRHVAGFGYRAGMRFASESECLKPVLSTYLGQPVHALPTIAPWPESIPAPSAVNRRARIGMLGAGRWEKNLGQFVEALIPGSGGLDHPDYQVVVQIDETFGSYTRRCNELLTRLRTSGINLQLIEHPLNGKDFTELLMSLDILALPNQPCVSATAASGIFTQALGLGVVPVVPMGTWMATQAKREGLGVIYDEYTATGLRQALDQTLEQRFELQQKIMDRAEDWRIRHSTEVFLDQLVAMVEDESA